MSALWSVILCVLVSQILLCAGASLSKESSRPEPPATNSTILANSPRFVVRLPDKHLLCFSLEGYELFTYNLITSSYLVLNGFLNLTSIPPVDGVSQMRGFGDVGILIKAVDRRIKAGRRYFKHLIYGERKKAIMEGFGEVELRKGAVLFNLKNGHSNIESQQSAHEQFRLTLDKPRTDILISSSNGHTFNVYVLDGSGLVSIDIHGLLGKHVCLLHVCPLFAQELIIHFRSTLFSFQVNFFTPKCVSAIVTRSYTWQITGW